MDKEIIFLVEESEEGGFLAKALGFSIFTEGETYEELKIVVKEAVPCHFDENERPKVIRFHIVRDEVIAI